MNQHVPPLFAALVDDAGLFPPTELPVAAALARHRADAAAGSPVLTGRFLCPAGQVRDALDALPDGGRPLRLGLITPLDRRVVETTLDRLAPDPRVELTGVEGPWGDLSALGAVPAGVPCFVETPRGDLAAVTEVAAAGYGAKVRCGGVRAELFPPAAELAAFVTACVRAGVPFKATAGLHHALPYRDPETGFHHYGFLNLLLATARAVEGGDVEEVLRGTDSRALVAEAAAIPESTALATRQALVAYGSCSTSDPVSDLAELGLLGAQVPAR
jgi:hypothetical protein